VPRPRKKKLYLIQSHTRIAINWDIERVYVFTQKAYTLASARESARRRLAKLGAFVGNLEAYHFERAPKELRFELGRQNHVRDQQDRFLWLRKPKTKLVIDRSTHKLRVIKGGM
jgi:hypothetical protein